MLVLGILAVLGAVGFGIATFAGNDEPTVAHPVSAPTTEETGPFPTAQPTATQPTAAATTQRPVPTKTKTTPPPPPPLTPNQVATANRLYKTAVQRTVGCRESSAGLANAASAGRYYRQIKACLDRAWPRQIVAAGYKFKAPGLLTFAGRANSPCGTTTDNRAFYCSTNHILYMELTSNLGSYRANAAFGRAEASSTVAHEYGHAMQNLTGILWATYRLEYDSHPTPAKKLELNRRMELQASCLGSVFLGANKGSYGLGKGRLYTQWLYIANNVGDQNAPKLPRDHGNGRSYGYWSVRGFTQRTPRFCNTFVAPANRVS